MASLPLRSRIRTAATTRIFSQEALLFPNRSRSVQFSYSSAHIHTTSSSTTIQAQQQQQATEKSENKEPLNDTEQALTQQVKFSDDSQLQKTMAATKAYLEKVQADVRPRLQAYLQKLNQASQQLKFITSDVKDSREALKRASSMLNELTGYKEIDALKKRVTHQAAVFENTRDQVQEAKTAYEAAIETRSATQRGINELLQRKHLWTGDDVTKFTELYRLEHAHSQAETAAKEKYQASEKQMDREYMELARSIMERYHEEQLWSDKIRSVSTYGTWALMVVNLLLFVAVQTVFEPRKRQKLTDRFEELLVAKVNEEEEKFQTLLEEKDKLFTQQQAMLLTTLNQLAEHPLFEEKDVLQSLLKQATIESPTSVKETDENIPTTATAVEPVLISDSAMNGTAVFTGDEELHKSMSTSQEELLDSYSTGDAIPTAIVDTDDPILEHDASATLTLSKNKLILYTIESAVAGGLLTAACTYFFR